MKRWRTRIFVGSAVVLLALLIVYAMWPAPIEADLATAVRGPLRVTVDEDGKTRIKDRFIVSAPLAGRLQRIALRAGDQVKGGETLLAVIEPKDPELLDASARAQAEARVKAMEAARKQAGANLDKTRSDHKFAATELSRLRTAFESGGASRKELDDAESKDRSTAELMRSAQFLVHVADFELEQAKAALIRTRPRSTGEPDDSRFEIRAPIDGRVLRVFQESATVVSPGTQLLELGNIVDLEIVIDVLSADGVRISPGARVWLEHWGGAEPLPARVRLVEPGAFTKISSLGVEEQRVNVIADFEGPPEKYARLGDAYRVEARIVIWESPSVLKVPAGALFRHGDGWAVFRVVRGRAQLQPVKIGHSNGLETEILDGLGENDSVVAYPSDKVRSGVAIKPR
jgi:HlyD family secretion protein